jgi:monoamine oxidase
LPQTQPAIGNLVAKLDLPVFTQHTEGDAVFEQSLHEAAQRFRGLQQEPPSMRLAGGAGSLVRALVRKLPGDQLKFGTRVTAMRLMDQCVESTIEDTNGRRDTVRAAQVIAALPPRLLEAMVCFEPQLEPQTTQRWKQIPRPGWRPTQKSSPSTMCLSVHWWRSMMQLQLRAARPCLASSELQLVSVPRLETR